MKLELHEHISRLLYDHECVVVPGFGAFLTRYYAAEVNHATHMMRPPSRRVYFNSSIRENDGLLAKSISYAEQVTYQKALTTISNEVDAWQKVLKSGKKLNLSGIGRLYLDDASRLQFNPSLEINYTPASYGLGIFRSPAIQREVEIRKSISKAIEKHVITEHPETNKKKVAGWVSWAAVLGPVILASAIGYAYFTTTPQVFENNSGFNWISYSRNISNEMVKDNAAPEETVTSTENTSPEREAAVEKVVEEKMEIAAPAPVKGHYHIVVGSFKDQENASTYISELQAKGYDAYLAQGDQSYQRVAIGNFVTEDEARNALAGIKQNVHPHSWIYTH